MNNRKELNVEEMNNVVGGLINGKVYTVSGTKHFLGFRNDYCYDDSNIVKTFHNGDQLVYLEDAPNGYALVEDPTDGRVGYVNKKYLGL